MGQLFKSACTHIEVWTAGPRILNHPHELLLPLPPFWRQYSERKPRIHPSASLCARPTYSGRPSGAEKSQADRRVTSERGYAASCIPPSVNSPSAHSGEYSFERTRV
jgi:hypothetical protein